MRNYLKDTQPNFQLNHSLGETHFHLQQTNTYTNTLSPPHKPKKKLYESCTRNYLNNLMVDTYN